MKQPKRTVCGCIVARVVRADIEMLLVTEDGLEWGIPKGGVEPEEEHEAAAIRETLEETGIPVKTVGYMGTSGRLSVWYALPLDESQEPVPQAGEILDAKYFPLNMLPRIEERQMSIVSSAVESLRLALGI